MALLHGYPLGLFDHPKWTSQVRAEDALNATLELDKTGEQVKGSNSWASKSTTRGAWLSGYFRTGYFRKWCRERPGLEDYYHTGLYQCNSG